MMLVLNVLYGSYMLLVGDVVRILTVVGQVELSAAFNWLALASYFCLSVCLSVCVNICLLLLMVVTAGGDNSTALPLNLPAGHNTAASVS